MPHTIPSLRERCRGLLEPLALAAYGTWALVAFEQVGGLLARDPQGRLWPVLATLVIFLAAFVARELTDSLAAERGLVALQLAMAWANVVLLASGSGPILGVIAAAQLAFLVGVRSAALLVLASVAIYAAIFAFVWNVPRPWFVAGLYGGFQYFALLTARLAYTANRQRDELAQVNAHLLATRSLLEAGARDGERLRLSRELHDVAGHSLTALRLHLELALRVPETERGQRVLAARDLADGLLEDIRNVVGQLRRHDGIALEPALRALTERLPGPRIVLDIEPGLRVEKVSQAEALLRCAQESLTNALRHANARSIRVRVHRDAGEVRMEIADDGRGCDGIVSGNGFTGMRERIAEAGGHLILASAPGSGFRVEARLPDAERPPA